MRRPRATSSSHHPAPHRVPVHCRVYQAPKGNVPFALGFYYCSTAEGVAAQGAEARAAARTAARAAAEGGAAGGGAGGGGEGGEEGGEEGGGEEGGGEGGEADEGTPAGV